MPVGELIGTAPRGSLPCEISSDDFVDAILQAASGLSGHESQHKRQKEGVLESCFLSTFPFAMVPLKLMVIAERYRLELLQTNANEIALWRAAKMEARKSGKSELVTVNPLDCAGLEVIVHSPPPHSAEYRVAGKLKGLPDDEFARKSHEELPQIVEQIRAHLQNLTERRMHQRIPTEFPVRIYPLYPDGVIGLPIGGRCQDVSLTGLRLLTPAPIRTERLYIEFHEVDAVARYAVYLRVIRTTQDLLTQWSITGGRFRQRG